MRRREEAKLDAPKGAKVVVAVRGGQQADRVNLRRQKRDLLDCGLQGHIGVVICTTSMVVHWFATFVAVRLVVYSLESAEVENRASA